MTLNAQEIWLKSEPVSKKGMGFFDLRDK